MLLNKQEVREVMQLVQEHMILSVKSIVAPTTHHPSHLVPSVITDFAGNYADTTLFYISRECMT